MRKTPFFTRPTFDQAMNLWKKLLKERGLPEECAWLFEENLCFEKAKGSEDVALKYQTRFTPPPPDAERIAFQYFAGFEAPVVFYRIGSSNGKSLCVLLCDPWFEHKGLDEGFISMDDWLILFRPGTAGEMEEITDAARWKTRLVKPRPLHEVDFSMTLRAVHETLAHGRVLSSYEHYALKFLHTWKQFSANKNRLDKPKSPR